MAVKQIMALGLMLLAGAVFAEEQYYQVDPAKLAALEAQRCASYQKEAGLIKRRLGAPTNRQSDVTRMKEKLTKLDGLIAKSCTVASQPAKR